MHVPGIHRKLIRSIFGIWLIAALIACQPAQTPTAADDFPTAVATPVPSPTSFIPTLSESTQTTPTLVVFPGSTVVYVKNGNLWLWQGAGLPIQLTDSGADANPWVSSDSQVIAFIRSGHLWAINTGGANLHALDSLDTATEILQFTFLPQSHSLYFTTGQPNGGKLIPNNDLYLVDADTPPAHQLLDPGAGGRITISPDGQWLALAQPAKINIASRDGSGLKTVLKFPPVSTANGTAYLPQIVWLSNNFGFKTVIPAANASEPARYLFVAAEGGEPAQLALIDAAPVSEDYFPVISPNSDNVAYLRKHGDSFELHLIDASTADQTLLTSPIRQLGLLGWAADGQSLVYWQGNPGNTQLRSPNGNASPLGEPGALAAGVTWLNASTYLSLNGAELRIRTLGQPAVVIDLGPVSAFAGVMTP